MKKKIKEINFSDVPGFNNLTAYKQSKLIRTYNIKKLEMKFNFFMLGIHDRKILVNTINSFKSAGLSPDDERMIIYCACMSRKLYHLNKFLYKNFQTERHQETKLS